MGDIRGFTLDFSQLFNILQQFNKFNEHVLFQLLSTNSASILPDLLERNGTVVPVVKFFCCRFSHRISVIATCPVQYPLQHKLHFRIGKHPTLFYPIPSFQKPTIAGTSYMLLNKYWMSLHRRCLPSFLGVPALAWPVPESLQNKNCSRTDVGRLVKSQFDMTGTQ